MNVTVKIVLNKKNYCLMFYFLVCFKAQRVSATFSETEHQFKFDNNFECYLV